MKRISIPLIALLAFIVAACGSNQAGASADATESAATREATPEPTPTQAEPTETESSDDSGSDDTALLDLVPDEIGGMSRTDVNFADNPIFAQALAGSGVDGSEVEYVISTWGDGDITLSAMRIPGMDRTSLEALAQAMAGVNSVGGAFETVTVGGKTVLSITGESVPGVAYMYFAGDAMFTVVGESPELADEVLSALP